MFRLFDGAIMIIKEVKEYGTKTKRQRIEFNKSDGLSPGSEVVILTTDEYNKIKSQLFDLQSEVTAKDKELEIYQNQEQNLKQIIEDTTSPIHNHYKNEIKTKQVKIKQLEMELKALHNNTTRFIIELMDLNLLDKIRSKDSKLIKSFNDEITTFELNPKIVEADGGAIPGGDRSGNDKNQK